MHYLEDIPYFQKWEPKVLDLISIPELYAKTLISSPPILVINVWHNEVLCILGYLFKEGEIYKDSMFA